MNTPLKKLLPYVLAVSLASCTTVNPGSNPQKPIPSLEECETISKKEILEDIEGYLKVVEMGFRQGRPLTPKEMKHAHELKIADPEGIRVLEYDRIPFLLKRMVKGLKEEGIDLAKFDPYGYAFPRTILLKKGNSEELTTIIHELVHIKQFQEKGIINFDAQAMQNFALYGYEDSPEEVEARDLAEELQK